MQTEREKEAALRSERVIASEARELGLLVYHKIVHSGVLSKSSEWTYTKRDMYSASFLGIKSICNKDSAYSQNYTTVVGYISKEQLWNSIIL